MGSRGDRKMRKILAAMSALIFIITLPACSVDTQSDDYFGFSKQDFTVVEEKDTHGGFHGDGSYYLILDCSDNAETALKMVESWNNLPLSENLDLIMFGGEKDGISYTYDLFKEAHMPKIENGYYCFRDRRSEAKNASDDSELLSRNSFDFSLAVYDSDTNIFYYFEFDT